MVSPVLSSIVSLVNYMLLVIPFFIKKGAIGMLGRTDFALLLPCVLIGAANLCERSYSQSAVALIRTLLAVGLAGML